MPRTRLVLFETQVCVFLDYRRQGKVYPVAKAYGLSRSTVAGIVEDFVDKGFSRGPRLNLPADLLLKLQERHIQDVVEELRRSPLPGLKSPKEHTPSVQLLDNEGEQGYGLIFPESGQALPREDDDLVWHLRETNAENILGHARQALRQFDLQCQELWTDLSVEVQRVCNPNQRGESRTVNGKILEQVRVAPYQPQAKPVEDPGVYIPHELVNLVYWYLFDPELEVLSRPALWRHASGQPGILMAGTSAVAVGAAIHEAVRGGISELVAKGLDRYRRRAVELEATFHDLVHLSAVLSEAFSEIREEQVHRGICPKCPYPEAILDLPREKTATGPGTGVVKGGAVVVSQLPLEGTG